MAASGVCDVVRLVLLPKADAARFEKAYAKWHKALSASFGKPTRAWQIDDATLLRDFAPSANRSYVLVVRYAFHVQTPSEGTAARAWAHPPLLGDLAKHVTWVDWQRMPIVSV